MRTRGAVRVVKVGLGAVAAISTLWGAAAAAAAGGDRWLEIRLAGEPTGSYHEQVTAAGGGGGTRTLQEMLFVINRMGSKVRIETHVETSEDAAGHLTAVHASVSSSQQAVTIDGARTARGLELTTRAGDKSYGRTLAVAGELLGPEGAARLARERLRAAGDTVSYQTFAADTSAVATVTRTLVRAEDFAGQPALAVEERSDATPGVVQLWLDRGGRLLGSAVELPFGRTEMRLAERAAAIAATTGAALPAESYDRTLARSNVRLPDARAIEAVKLRLTHRRPELGWPAFTGPGQRILSQTPAVLELEIRRPGLGLGLGAAEAPGGGGDGWLAPNALVQADDAEVARLAREVAFGVRDRFAAARALQDWAATHVEFDAGIALASASEVVRNRRGTCIAFAVLLTAMERAAGIPARIAMGYAYADGIWGGHAWTEVQVGGEWVPLDAALYAPGVADAARFQFGSYGGEDNLAAATAAAARVYGNLDVRVVEYTIGGQTHSVPEGAPGYEAAGDTYRNPWLGISVQKPAGARFEKLNAVFPDAAVVAVAAGAATVEVEYTEWRGDRGAAVAKQLAVVAPAGSATPAALDGRPALLVSSADKVRMVVVEGNSLWVLTGAGAGAADLMARVAEGWHWTPAR